MAKAETDEKVMAMVEAELKKNPNISVDELQKKATKINKQVSSLTARQFHARYPLQVKRRKASGKRSTTPTARKTAAKSPRSRRASRRGSAKASSPAPAAPAATQGADRDAIRSAFLSFATDLAAAEERKDVVKVLAGVDKYVDQVARAASK
jgi:hypothetical protein